MNNLTDNNQSNIKKVVFPVLLSLGGIIYLPITVGRTISRQNSKDELEKSQDLKVALFIINQLNNKLAFFFKERIKKFKIEEINEALNDIYLSPFYSYSQIVRFIAEDMVNHPKQDIKMNHFNILVLGQSGVGKTTLIKEALKYNESPKSNIKNNSINQVEHKNENLKSFFRFFDTNGIKLDNISINISLSSVIDFIENEINYEKLINCIWYCTSRETLEEAEIEYLKTLKEICSEKQIPIIIVNTQCADKSKSNLIKDIIFNELNQTNENFYYIPVLAKDSNKNNCGQNIIIPKFGVDKLLNLSINKGKKSIKSSYINFLKKEISKNFYSATLEKFNSVSKKLLQNEVTKLQEDQRNVDEKINDFKGIFGNIVDSYLLEKESLNRTILDNNEWFIDQYIEIIRIWKRKKMNELLEEFNKEFINMCKNDHSDDITVEEIDLYFQNNLDFLNNETKKMIIVILLKYFGEIMIKKMGEKFKSCLDNALSTLNPFFNNLVFSKIKDLIESLSSNISKE